MGSNPTPTFQSSKPIYLVVSEGYELSEFRTLKEAKTEAQTLEEEFEDSGAVVIYKAVQVKR